MSEPLNTPNTPPKRDRLIRLPEVMTATGMKKTAVYTAMNEGRFPKNVRINRRMSVWSEAAVLQWVQDRLKQGSPA